MKVIEIRPQKIETNDKYHIRRCVLTRIAGGVVENNTELWYQFDKNITPPDDTDCDSYLLGILMDAMKEGRDIIVKGKVSKELLSNLVEYQLAWRKWVPNVYVPVNIDADIIKNDQNPLDGAVCAFSGGVDACFSVWRHSKENCSYRSQKIKISSLVHGFDIPLHEESSFSNALRRANDTLKDICISLEPIKTNYRKISNVNWEHACACALIATLSNFKKIVGTCIVGSSEPYDSLIIPWGSSPITDHLLSSNDFRVIHDGASHSRIEKVREISSWKAGVENLRVCWQGPLKDRNCGQCEKCVRTKLNFLATGSDIPNCFPRSDIIADIKRIRLKKKLHRNEWQLIYNYAVKNGIKSEWLRQVSKKLYGPFSMKKLFL